ncbi:MAG: hypothetical protein E5V25_10045, partial [Mesorhizobium sp.]
MPRGMAWRQRPEVRASDEAKLGGSCRRTLSRPPAVHRKLSQALRSDTFRYTSHALLMPREIAAVAQKVIIRVDANQISSILADYSAAALEHCMEAAQHIAVVDDHRDIRD